MRGTGADRLVVVLKPGNAGGAKGTGHPGLLGGQPGLPAGSFQDHGISLRVVKGRFMARVAQRVASEMSCRPVSRRAPMARLRRAAMTRGPDRVRAAELSSR